MSSHRPAVLAVDDVAANLVALEGQLARLDCQVDRASSGNDALRMLLKREYALMLLDVQMPEMDGYEVARHARENPATRDVPIIFLTAMNETPQNALKGYGAGAVDLLFKPVDPDIVRSKVQVFLELYASRQRLANEVEAHKRTLADLEAFSYSVSHDLRAPLRSIAGFSQIILDDYGAKLDEPGLENLRHVISSAKRMRELIDDLLALAQVEKSELKRTRVDLSAEASAIAGELQGAQTGRMLEFVIAPDMVVDADRGLVRVVLQNLLANAVKFTARAPRARIEVGETLHSGMRAYFVRDNGVGFQMAFVSKLFGAFQRLHSQTEFEGTGIGLATVLRVAKRHGGSAWAEAVPNAGATIFFTLSLASTG